jgi:hypothetical protein
MYVMDGKKKGNKVDHEFPNEKSIFDFLKMEYKRPEDRIDGRSVVPIRGSPPLETLDLPKNEAATQAPKNVTIKKRLNKEEKEREKAKLKAEKEAAKLAAKKAKEEEKERKQMETRKKREEKKEQEKKLKESRKTKKQRRNKENPQCPRRAQLRVVREFRKPKQMGNLYWLH